MATLFKRILAPVDGTPRGDAGLDAACHLARRIDASMLILHVEDRMVASTEVIDDDESFARRTQVLREQGVDVHYALAYDRPEIAIAQTATTEHSDLIVLAPHHHGRLEPLYHPSVTARMLAHAPVPLLIWPDMAPRGACSTFLTIPSSVVLVPVDGSIVAEQAIPYAVWFASEFHRPVVLVRVVAPEAWESVGVSNRTDAHESPPEQLRAAQRYLASLRRRIAQEADVTVQSMLLNGDPATALVRLAQTHEGSLLLMSTHGRTGLNRLMFGSVTAEVMLKSTLPLLVVPPAAQHLSSTAMIMAREVQHVSAI